MAPRPSDRPHRTDPAEQREQAIHSQYAAALHVASRFREQPDVAKQLLDMLGLLGPSPVESLDPGPAERDRTIAVHWRSR